MAEMLKRKKKHYVRLYGDYVCLSHSDQSDSQFLDAQVPIFEVNTLIQELTPRAMNPQPPFLSFSGPKTFLLQPIRLCSYRGTNPSFLLPNSGFIQYVGYVLF